MKMKKSYKVRFNTKLGGWVDWRIDIDAMTAKEARQIAEERWKQQGHKAHMFGIEVKLLKPGEEFLYHTFVKTHC